MAEVGAIGRGGNVNLPARIDTPTKNQDAKIDTRDKVTLGGVMRKAGKYALGTGLAVIVAPAAAIDNAISGTIDGGMRGLDIEGPQKGIGKNLQKLAITGGAIFGAVCGATMGPVGVFTGAMLGPGVAGGLISGGKGAIEGSKTGFEVTRSVARKVDEKVAGKVGKFLGKAAKVTTAVALGAVAIPGLAVIGSISKGFDFARKAMGVNPKPKTAGQAVGRLAQEGAMLYGYVTGAIEAGPGLVPAVAGGVATAGGIGTGIAGVKAGAKGFVKGLKASYYVAGKVTGADKK